MNAELIEAWSRGAYSLWTGGTDCATWSQEKARGALDDWYGADSPESAQETIDELALGADAEDSAWDKVRAIDLLRIALAAGFIDRAACHAKTVAIARELQRQYADWEALAKAFEAGMHRWQRGNGVTDPKRLARVQNNLPILRTQIWAEVDFDAALG